ncbi:MAG TPA: hypothetical protein VL426_05150 [Candidatus Binatia bacterium]|jgi:hypothetical protein|nr:hypothetical protein [Candidatus Binatia bacterium]
MEACKICGHAGEHAPDCPAAPPEKEPVPGFSRKEMYSVVHVRDRVMPYAEGVLDKVTPDNIGDLIDADVRGMVTRRGEANREDFPPGMPAAAVLDKLYRRSSSGHAIQCSVQRAEDCGFLVDRVQGTVRDNGLAADDPDAAVVRAYASRQERQNDLLTRLFEKDVARRIGDLKGDGRFFERAMADFDALADEIHAELAELERDDAALIAQSPDLRQQIDTLSGRLVAARGKDAASLAPGFYGDIAMLYSAIIFQDSERNEDEVMAAAARLDAKGR